MLWDYRPEYPSFHGIVMQEFDAQNNALIGERKSIYEGTPGNVTEGAQIFKKDGYYYLLCAEGGTGYKHSSTILRSKSVWGPFEKSPYWPLISARDTPEHPLQKAGHACFIEVGEAWYITFLCARPLTERGNCTLGRETGIAKIE
jgi:xylan 1,4-beta-xylosidase